MAKNNRSLPATRPRKRGIVNFKSMALAALRQAFLQPDQASAQQTRRHVADQLRPRWPKLGKARM